jgi:hypothetical protein
MNITYIPMARGFVYLTVVDWFNGCRSVRRDQAETCGAEPNRAPHRRLRTVITSDAVPFAEYSTVRNAR